MTCIYNEAENCELLKAMSDKLDSYQLCVEKSLLEVNTLNVKHEQRVNELSTIINIFEYINMVTDYKNLFAIINDMLIGVLGASSSTMFKYEEGCYRVEASSLSRQEVLHMNAVGAKLCKLYEDRSEAFILSKAELLANFSERKETKSAVIVPLTGKKELLGVIFLEHTREDYFQPDNCKYLNTLGITIRLSLENARLYSRLEEMALVDGLTGLYNRMFFNKQINNCMEDYKTFGLPFILAILDLDHFKRVNDTYGHVCGDMVLQQISGIIKSEIRSDDFVCRYGGEEFAIIFRNSRDIEGVGARLESIRQKIEKSIMEYQENKVISTCSFGAVCCTTSDKINISDEVVRKADEALYNAKKAGRNRICIAM